MNTARRFIGLLLIVFLGLPTLFGIIWAVGMIKASVSAEFLTDLPREIIADIPDKADEIFREAQDDRVIFDDNTRAWFQAAAKTGISPRDLMEKTGLLEWLDGELSDSLRQIGRVLRGERRPRPITIDLRPLQAALLHPEVDRFLEETLKNLPPCDERGQMLWGELALGDIRRHEIPACQPDLETAKAVLIEARLRAVDDMDDRVEVFEGVRSFPLLPFGISGTITFLSYFLFMIPAAFIFLGALIAASSPAGFFRWSGVSVLVGGLPTLILALATKFFSLWAIKAAPFFEHDYWASDLGDLVLNKLGWIPERIVNQLFSPVVWVAALVCVTGAVLYALSFTVRDRSRKAQKPVSPPPAPVVPPKSEG
jgi:hypothetical protein